MKRIEILRLFNRIIDNSIEYKRILYRNGTNGINTNSL